MIDPSDLKLAYAVSCIILGLIIVTPTLAVVVTFPGGERFSELWLLGQNHMTEDYPFNVKANKLYSVHLGIGNHMDCLEYYAVYVKFRNRSESSPSNMNGTASILEPVFEYRVFLRENDVWEKDVLFSFENVSFAGNFCKVSKLIIDGSVVSVDKVAFWDQENNGFYYQMFFELWFYNFTTSGLQYHNRYVSNWLNFTTGL